MPTQADIREHRGVIEDLTTVAQAEAARLVVDVDASDPKAAAAALRDAALVMSAEYTAAASTVASDWYEAMRDAAAVGTAYEAATLAAPDPDAVQNVAGYVLAPLFVPDTPDMAAVSDRMGNFVEDVVGSADRQTVEANAALDPEAPMYARHASANACAFCRMLATRGSLGDNERLYTSKEAATHVVLPSAERPLGEKFHDNCRCTAVPVWNKADYEPAPYVEKWAEAYTSATHDLGGASDIHAILAHMRESLGISH